MRFNYVTSLWAARKGKRVLRKPKTSPEKAMHKLQPLIKSFVSTVSSRPPHVPLPFTRARHWSLPNVR